MIYLLIIHACLALIAYLFLIEDKALPLAAKLILILTFIINIFLTVILLFYIWGTTIL